MRTTITLDKTLVDRASALTGITQRSILVREALKALVERESAKRLASLGASEPNLIAPSR